MITLIAYHADMLQTIINTRLLHALIIKLIDPKYSIVIRSNAVLAIALLTYHDALYNDLIKDNVIDMMMELCSDPQLDLKIKIYSTLALVHFALKRQSL